MQPNCRLNLTDQTGPLLLRSVKHAVEARRHREANQRALPETLGIKLTNRCTLRCAHCYQWNESGYYRDMDRGEQDLDLDIALFGVPIATDTVGEFPSEAIRPELGEDRASWQGESAASDAPDEFANGICKGRKNQRTWSEAPVPPRFAFSKAVSEGLNREIEFENVYRESKFRRISRTRGKGLAVLENHRLRLRV
jgi:hypothetical protein